MFDQKNFAELHTWVAERLSDFIDQQLAPNERARVETHLADCAQCRASLESMRWTMALVKQTPPPTTQRSFALPVPARREPSSFAFGFARFATALATVLLFAVIGIDLISQFGGASAPVPAAMRESAPTQAVAFAATQAPAPTSAPKPAEAQPAGAPLPPAPAPAAVPPAAPTPSAVFRASEVSPTQSAADTSPKSQGATQPARQPSVGGTAPVTSAITATATLTPTQTATIVPPTSTPLPTLAPTPVPPPQPIVPAAPVVSTLRVVQVLLLFLAIFFGTMTLLLWWRK